MKLESEDVWEAAEEGKTLHERALQYLKENPESYFRPTTVSDVGLEEESLITVEDLPPELQDVSELHATVSTFRIETVLDSLVEDGLVEKRMIPLEEVVRLEDKKHDITSNLPKHLQEWKEDNELEGEAGYYRIAEELR